MEDGYLKGATRWWAAWVSVCAAEYKTEGVAEQNPSRVPDVVVGK
jgi:hypothetical protein